MILENGHGTGDLLKVDSEGQAHVRAQSHKEVRHHSGKGDAYCVQSGYVTSSASADQFASILYFKNDSTTKSVYIGLMRTCNEVAAKWRVIKNPTSISNSTSITPENSNFSSSKAIDATAEYGSATSTTTGGTVFGTWINGGPAHSVTDMGGGIILGPKDSIVLEMAPFAAAAGEVCCLLEVWQVVEQ